MLEKDQAKSLKELKNVEIAIEGWDCLSFSFSFFFLTSFCDGYDSFYVICLFFILNGRVKKQKQGIYYPI